MAWFLWVKTYKAMPNKNTFSKMKKHLFVLLMLMFTIGSAWAVTYPSRPYSRKPEAGTMPSSASSLQSSHLGYYNAPKQVSTLGADGRATAPSAAPSISGGPRRELIGSGENRPPQGTKEDDQWIDENGVTWTWNGTAWVSEQTETNQDDASNPMPLGSAWVMLLFAAFFATTIALRRRPQA